MTVPAWPPASSGRLVLAGLALVAVAALAGCASTPSTPPPLSLAERAAAPFGSEALAGAQWGLAVVRGDGTPVVAIGETARFLPASNMKVLTSAAAMAVLPALDAAAPGTRVALEPRAGSAVADIALVGGGDLALSDGPDCVSQCLAALADAVAASGVAEVHDVIGDESWFPPEPHVAGWSWEDLQWPYGAPVSALSLNENTVRLQLAPADTVGAPARVAWAQGDDGMVIDNRLVTRFEPEADYRVHRAPGSDTVSLTGAVPLGAPPETIALAMDDPARHAAERFRRHLEARGIAVRGTVRVRRIPVAGPADPAEPIWLGVLPPAPLQDTVLAVSKDSSNLGAELLLRHLGRLGGAGTTEDGLAVLAGMLESAGVDPRAYDLSDGSGLSIYNRISPAAMVRLLLWIADQPWGEAWIAAQPVGAVDGTLARRFGGSALAGRVYAKTGTLFGANTLSGFLDTADGDRLAFSVMVNDRDAETGSATDAIDAALLAIAGDD